MAKKCIFNNSKECNDCKDCEVCIFDKNKLCNNCGKCLELEGVDIKAINIEEIAKNIEENDILEEDIKVFDDELVYTDEDYSEEEFEEELEEEYEDAFDHIEYLDDDELLNDANELEELTEELYPGVRVFKRKK